jgi:heme exporter protein C
MQQRFQSLANPTRFMALSARLVPWLAGLTILLLVAGLVMAFLAPPDYQHKHTVKIMFVHVPSAWLAMGGYLLVAMSSFGYLVWRHPRADVSAKAAAPIGAAFALLTLITGSLWGKPGWGTYWAWDARLTSVLILFFMYLGLIALRSAFDDEALAARLTAILAVVGIVILPVIKFSVDWWNSLHQGASVLRLGRPALHSAFLWPLLVMALAMALLFAVLHLKAMRNEILRRRLAAMRLSEVERAARDAVGGAPRLEPQR